VRLDRNIPRCLAKTCFGPFGAPEGKAEWEWFV